LSERSERQQQAEEERRDEGLSHNSYPGRVLFILRCGSHA
jgi:hypothetical protein